MRAVTAVCALLGPLLCVGEVFEGHMFSIDSWAYLARFSFVEDVRKDPDNWIEYNITYQKGAKLSLAAYYSGFNGWDQVYDSDLRCNERLDPDFISMRMLVRSFFVFLAQLRFLSISRFNSCGKRNKQTSCSQTTATTARARWRSVLGLPRTTTSLQTTPAPRRASFLPAHAR
jgi:hypothetical protein